MTKKLRIIADENIPALFELLGDVADITCLPGRTMQPADLRDADALLVRSVTKVDACLLQQSNLRFVGTCTIGTDHVDETYLEAHDIAFASAPGCNAAAVVDYVVAAMLAIYNDLSLLKNKTVGIVGYGQVGSRLQQRLQDLGIACKVCDPFKPQGTATLEEILACDIISLHVPYTTQGEHATHHLLGVDQLEKIKPGSLLINSSRGSVVDNTALFPLLQQHRFYTVLDVYEDEPAPGMALLDALDIATAHIAGYSVHGKIRGTLQVVEALFEAFGIDKAVADLLSPLTRTLVFPQGSSVADLVRQAYDIREDSRCFIELMRNAAGREEKAMAFDAYRKNYPVRYEWSYTQVKSSDDKNDIVKKLGFGKK